MQQVIKNNLWEIHRMLDRGKHIFINGHYANAEDRLRLIKEAKRATAIAFKETNLYINITI